jgi:hypothetical protein
MSKLNIEKQNSKLENLKLYETIDVKLLDKLITSELLQTVPWVNPQTGEKVCYDNEKQHLLALRKKVKNGKLEVLYKNTNIGFGRVYPTKSLSLCSIRRELRHTLAKDKYVDIDIDNCHPVILKQICEKNKIDCEYLTKYVNDRKTYLKVVMDKYKVDRDSAKQLFIRLAYFGTFEAWKNDNNIESDVKLKFIKNYTLELQNIGLQIVNANPNLLKQIKKMNKNNETASLVSTYLQEYEKRILECVFNHLRLKKIIDSNAVLCFDGIMIPIDKYKETILKELELVVKDEMGFDVNFSSKEMDQDYLKQLENVVDESSFEGVANKFEQNHCKIVSKAVYLKHSHVQVEVFSAKKLQDAYCDLVFKDLYGDDDGFIGKWMNKNANIRKYEDMDIYPHPLVCPENHFNMWTPFKLALLKGDYTKNEVGKMFILNHLKAMCDNDEIVFDYVVKWIAQLLQYPATKSVCLSFVGNQGTGKSSIVRIIGALIGENKVFETTSPSRDCWGDFNSPMVDAFLVSIPELSKKDFIEGESKFKGIVTDPTIYINAKGINQYKINSYHRVINTSNSDDPVKTSKDDRRNVVIRCSDEFKNNTEHFKTLYEYLSNESVLRTLYDYLMNIQDMDKFMQIPLPKTKHQEELRKLDMSVPEQFLSDVVAGSNQKEMVFSSDQMFELFNVWKSNNEVNYECNKIKFGMRLSVLRIDGLSTEHRKIGNVRILDIFKLKNHFNIV